MTENHESAFTTSRLLLPAAPGNPLHTAVDLVHGHGGSGVASAVLTSSAADELPTRNSCGKTHARDAVRPIRTAVINEYIQVGVIRHRMECRPYTKQTNRRIDLQMESCAGRRGEPRLPINREISLYVSAP